jgi:bacterial/archaeal transporter family protein
MNEWLFWALLSAVFQALTAIFAKAGVDEINRTWLAQTVSH